MDPLSKDADEALKSLLDVEPTRDDEARVRAELEKSLGIALPMAAAATSVAAAATAKGFLASLSVSAKISLVTVAVVGAGAATFAVRAMTRPLEPTVPVVAKVQPPRVAPPSMVWPELELAPEPEKPPEPEFELVLLAPPEPPRRAKPPVVAKPPAPVVEVATPLALDDEAEDDEIDVNAVPMESVDEELAREYPGCDLPTEQRLAAHVRWIPRTGSATAERGLELLSTYQHRCATGHWTYDSWVARFVVLCSLGRQQEVDELWAWFRQENEHFVPRLHRELQGVCTF